MSSIAVFVTLYISLSILLGIYSTRFIKTSTDFCLAGRNLSLLLCSSTMFSTWFGAETVIGAPAEFLQHGVLGIIEDPLGTSLCFILIGLLFAKRVYSLNIITIVDLFKIKYGVSIEKVSAVFMILSYIGWISAQLLAMAIIIKIIFNFPITYGIAISSSIVCFYTICGGMWSISINDFIQTIVIIVGLIIIFIYIYYFKEPYQTIINQAPENFFQITPEFKLNNWIKYIVAWLTVGLGSIPQQDVFQRIMSARTEKIAIYSSYISGFLYLTVGILPLLISFAFLYTDTTLQGLPYDQVLLQAILNNSNNFIKIIFFGALLSAIMSSASGAILAPATIIGENIIKPMFPNLSDNNFLKILRLSVLVTVVASALYTMHSPSVYLLVSESSVISLVSLFVPMVAALYWKKTSTLGAYLSIILGPIVWLLGLYLGFEESSVLLGLFASFIGMLLGNLRQAFFLN